VRAKFNRRPLRSFCCMPVEAEEEEESENEQSED